MTPNTPTVEMLTVELAGQEPEIGYINKETAELIRKLLGVEGVRNALSQSMLAVLDRMAQLAGEGNSSQSMKLSPASEGEVTSLANPSSGGVHTDLSSRVVKFSSGHGDSAIEDKLDVTPEAADMPIFLAMLRALAQDAQTLLARGAFARLATVPNPEDGIAAWKEWNAARQAA